MSKFGDTIKELRVKRGLTQASLADKLKICPSSVGMYEQGRREPDNEMLKKICNELNVSIDYILGLQPQKEKEVNDVIDEFTQVLGAREGLMFNGKPIGEDERKKIVNAIRVAAAVAISQSELL